MQSEGPRAESLLPWTFFCIMPAPDSPSLYLPQVILSSPSILPKPYGKEKSRSQDPALPIATSQM